MLNTYARAATAAVLGPLARALVRLGVSPNAVTVIGTLGVSIAALWFFPRGELLVGTLVITAFVFSDAVDGLMARQLDRTSAWGAFLDSTMDRIADFSVFAGLTWYFARSGDDTPTAALALACLGLGMLVSYIRARGEAAGFRVDIGIAERADRLVLTLVTTGLVGWFLPTMYLTVALAVLAVASVYTVYQRMALVRSQC